MKGVDKTVLLVLPMLALLAAFWFLILTPKREEAASLSDDVAALQASVDDQEVLVASAEAARESFPVNYRRLVVLGKAVPEDADTSSLLVQLSGLAAKTGVTFGSLDLAEGTGGSLPTAPPPAPATPATVAEQSEQQVAAVESGVAPTPAPPTEQAAASLPLGATVGPAGLPVMPYELGFSGDFFAIAKFIGKMNSQVGLHEDGTPAVFGRLMTIDAFSLTVEGQVAGAAFGPVGLTATNPTLEAQFAVTTFIVPPAEGLTAGASPTGPAPVGTPVATDSSAVPAPPTATVGATP